MSVSGPGSPKALLPSHGRNGEKKYGREGVTIEGERGETEDVDGLDVK